MVIEDLKPVVYEVYHGDEDTHRKAVPWKVAGDAPYPALKGAAWGRLLEVKQLREHGSGGAEGRSTETRSV